MAIIPEDNTINCFIKKIKGPKPLSFKPFYYSFFGEGGGSRTHVRKHFRKTFYEYSRLFGVSESKSSIRQTKLFPIP